MIIALGIVGNAAAFVVPVDYAGFGTYLYPGIFVLTFIANASVVLPIPYLPIVVRAAEVAPLPVLIVLAAAAGSTLGESVGYFVGRAGKKVVSGSRIYLYLQRVVDRPVLSALFLFLLSAPLNPLFDIAGVAAGALGIRYWIFTGAVFVGRIVRFGVIVWLGLGLTKI